MNGNYGTMVVNASTFSGNTARLSGGAIYNYLPSGSITVEDSTFSGKSAAGSARSIFGRRCGCRPQLQRDFI